MSSTDLVMGAAGVSTGPANYVDDVFSTYLYTGNGSSQTITNGIDLAGKGGLVWLKGRGDIASNMLYDTYRGVSRYMQSNASTASTLDSGQGLTSFNSNGFALTYGTGSGYDVNNNSITYASWTFREQPKFFDVVTFTGDGIAGRTVAHNLGSTPGMIIVKRLDLGGGWQVYHRSVGNTGFLTLNGTTATTISNTRWNNTSPTSTEFTIGSSTSINASGGTYIAYLFAHDAGGFGASGTDNVISCGSYTGTGAAGNFVSLGYEPQYVMIKASNGSGNWVMEDVMRGQSTTNSQFLYANTSDAEVAAGIATIIPNATGFTLNNTGTDFNGSGTTYIYMAIRRPMKPPTSGTEVFSPITYSGNGTNNRVLSGFGMQPDMVMLTDRNKNGYGSTNLIDRLRGGKKIFEVNIGYEETQEYNVSEFWNDGIKFGSNAINGWNSDLSYMSDGLFWAFRRATGFFDVVCYTGDGVDGRTVPHNLGVKPEFVIVKCRSKANYWAVRFANPEFHVFSLNKNTEQSGVGVAGVSNAGFIGNLNTLATATTFPVRDSGGATGLDAVNASGFTYVAYLFASVAGVSKVGSYTGNGSSQTINCGFAAGARFVMIKRTNSTGDWYIWDTSRGIITGNDPYLRINSSAAEVTTNDSVDPVSSGFAVNQLAATNINVTSATYIYLAIA